MTNGDTEDFVSVEEGGSYGCVNMPSYLGTWLLIFQNGKYSLLTILRITKYIIRPGGTSSAEILFTNYSFGRPS